MTESFDLTDAQLQVFESLGRITEVLDRERIHRPLLSFSLWHQNRFEDRVEFALHSTNDVDAQIYNRVFNETGISAHQEGSVIKINTDEVSGIMPEQEGLAADALEKYCAGRLAVMRLNQLLDAHMPISEGMFRLDSRSIENDFVATLILKTPTMTGFIARVLTNANIPITVIPHARKIIVQENDLATVRPIKIAKAIALLPLATQLGLERVTPKTTLTHTLEA